MLRITEAQRRARLAQRHAIAPTHRVQVAEAATRAMTVLHATEPATVYLSLQARVDGLTTADVDRAMYDDRSVVKQLAMRRTLFVFPRDLLPAALGSASVRVAEAEARRIAKDVAAAGLADDGDAWVQRAAAGVLEALADGGLTAAELREIVPALAERLEYAPGTAYGASVPIGPRVLTLLGVRGLITRGENAGHWRVSKPRWTLMPDWLDPAPVPATATDGYAELVRRWLATFGPGTETDIVWWLGATKAAVRRALADLQVVEATLDDGGVGYVLPDDVDPVEAPETWAALLPVLDPTVMGWKERDFYLGPHAAQLFDRNGNAGTTAWWDGRIVGCWVQDEAGAVRLNLLEDVPAQGRAALNSEADRLTEWLAGVRVGTVYPSPAMKSAR
jgi:hypothetical protein